MKQGILMIAAGHPYYGKMAAALAATIRNVDKVISIHLSYSESAVKYLSKDELALFNSMAIIPMEYYETKKGVQYIRTKMFMYDLSPFDKTLFLDCDLLWLKKNPLELFEQLVGNPISYQNYGFADLSKDVPADFNMWADVNDVKKAYSLVEGRYYQIHSEVFYFEKGAVAKKYFKIALKIYDNLKVKAKIFAGAVPDELPFTIASSQLELYPHKDDFIPSYWTKLGGHKHSYQLSEDYYLISMAGTNSASSSIETYNLLTSAAYHKLGLQQPYKWKNKKSFLNERKTI
jgi:hypothetical protein